MHLGQLAKTGDAAWHAVQHARGRIGQGLGAALLCIHQALAAGRQGLVHAFALGGDVGQKLFLLGKAAFDVFQLREQAGQRFVALFGRVRQLQRVFHGLAEQLELRAKLGALLGRTQVAAARAGIGAQAVDVGVQQRNAVEDGGALYRIAAGQAAQLLAEQVETGGFGVQRGQVFGQLPSRRRLGQGGSHFGQGLALAVKGFFVGQELQRALAHTLLLGRQLRGHRIDGGQIGIAQFTQQVQLALALAQAVQRLHKVAGAAPQLAGNGGHQLTLLAFGLVQRAAGVLADAFDLFKLAQRGLRGLLNAAQVGGSVLRLARVEPEVGVACALALADQVFVRGARGHLFAHHARNAQQVRDAAHQVGIAHAPEETRACGLAAGVFFGRKRRAPQLHGVHARGLAARGLEHQHAPIGEGAVPVGQDGRCERFFDKVVGEESVAARIQRGWAALRRRHGAIKDVGHVLAVGRALHARKAQLLGQLGRQIEPLGLARLQVVPAGEDDAVVLRQLHTRRTDSINAHHLLRALVEHQVARGALAVRAHLQQDQQAQLGIRKLGIAQRLVGVVHGLFVDAQARLGVVLDLHGERAAHGFDKHRVQHIDVRVGAAHMVLTRQRRPAEVVAGRRRQVALAPVVHVLQRAIAFAPPAEHADVLRLLPDLERRQQKLGRGPQELQRGLLVVGVQLVEVGHKTWVVQKAARHGHLHQFIALGRAHPFTARVVVRQLIQRKHVLHPRLAPEAHEHVVAKQQPVATDVGQVPRHAVVLGARTQAHQQLLVALAELFNACGIERLCLGQQLVALGFQALFQQLVAAAFGHAGVDGGVFDGSINAARCSSHGASFIGAGGGVSGRSLLPTRHCSARSATDAACRTPKNSHPADASERLCGNEKAHTAISSICQG